MLSPNPARDAVTVGYAAPQGLVSLGVFDATGKQIASGGEIMNYGTASSIRLDVSGLPSGTYYVRLSHATGATVKMLAVQR